MQDTMNSVTPRAGVWIEISRTSNEALVRASLPVRECGLKYAGYALPCSAYWSLPVRECGLKSIFSSREAAQLYVTPRAGVWIEICHIMGYDFKPAVTPRAGVWIEMSTTAIYRNELKVTPRAGVWIEMTRA